MKKTTLRRKNLRMRHSIKTDVATVIKLLEEFPEQTPIIQVANTLMRKLIELESKKETVNVQQKK